MKLGAILCWGDSLEQFRSELATAEESGMSVIGVGDVPFGWQEVYVSLGIAVHETRRAMLGPFVTTPFLRHPAITARAASSLYELSGGRFVLGFGAGASVPTGIGRALATQAELREYLLALRALLEGESITWEGRRVSALRLVNRVPIYLSAYAPKSQRLAVELADGVILSSSTNTTSLAEQVANVREAEREHGRTIDVWARSWWGVRETKEAAIEDIRAHLASGAAYRLRPKRVFARVPDHLKEKVLRIQRDYDVTKLLVIDDPNTALLDDPELTRFLADETAITGTPAEVGATVREIEAMGITCLLSSLMGNADPEGTMRRFAQAAAAPAPDSTTGEQPRPTPDDGGVP